MPLIESLSGIRGIFDDGLDEQVAHRYGHAYLSFLKRKHKKPTIVIGTDTRPSRDIIKSTLIEVLDGSIIDLGIASTPMTEFAVRHYKADGGIIVTASHNEPYWNGFKFLDKTGAVLDPKDMVSVIKNYNKIKNKNKIQKRFSEKKVFKKYKDINKLYSDYVLNFLSKKEKDRIKNSKLKVVIDPNGGTGAIAKQILENLNVKVFGINMKHGIFNRTVEPNESTLIYLANHVREKKYDLAAGFDCDADRMEVVTNQRIVSGNQLLGLIANEILGPGKTIVVNSATSSLVRKIARDHGARYHETEPGETNVVKKMLKTKAAIGGEGSSSGVIIPPSRCRDGILTLLFLLKLVAEKGKIEKLIEELPKYYNIRKKLSISPGRYSSAKNRITGHYKKKGYKVTSKGSLKVSLKDSFVWFRMSRTEADTLRIIADAPKRNTANLLMKEALVLLKNG